MELSLTDKAKVGKLVTIFRYLKNLSEMVNINLTKSLFYIQGLDASHACMSEVAICASWFDSYESDNMTLGVSCDILFKVINCWKEGQQIKLHAENGGDKLYIDFEGEGYLDKYFALPLIDIEADIFEIPKTEYPVDLMISSGIFKELIDEMAVFNDTLKFNCEEDSISFQSDGDSGKMSTTIKDDDIEILVVEEDYILDIAVGLNYIAQTCNFHKVNEFVFIHCSNEVPINIHYSLDNKNSDESESYVRFFVATKID